MTTPTTPTTQPKDAKDTKDHSDHRDAGTDVPAIEQALQKSFHEVAPAVDDATVTKLAHTAVNTLKGMNRLTPEPAEAAPKK